MLKGKPLFWSIYEYVTVYFNYSSLFEPIKTHCVTSPFNTFWIVALKKWEWPTKYFLPALLTSWSVTIYLSIAVITVWIISYSVSALYQIKTYLNIPPIPCGLWRVNSVSETHWRESLTGGGKKNPPQLWLAPCSTSNKPNAGAARYRQFWEMGCSSRGRNGRPSGAWW